MRTKKKQEVLTDNKLNIIYENLQRMRQMQNEF